MELERQAFGELLDLYLSSALAGADAPTPEESSWLESQRRTPVLFQGGAPDVDTVAGLLKAHRSQKTHASRGQFRVCVVPQSGAALAALDKLVVVRDTGDQAQNARAAFNFAAALGDS